MTAEARAGRADRNGLELYFEQSGNGDPPIVFLHPAASDHTFFAPQVTEFSADHRVVTLDQRGFGASSEAADGQYRPADLADDVAWLCSHLGLDKPFLVGCSMGGGIAVEAAARHPELASGIAVLNRSVIANRAQDSTIRTLAEMLRGPSAAEAIEMLVNAQIGPLDPPGLGDEYRRTARSTRPHVLAAVQEAFIDWDGEAALATVRVPALFTFSRPTGEYADLDRIRQLCPQVVIGHTVGAGHFENRSVPAQLNPMIQRFLEVYIAR
ncbi:alpha/beta hydrolase [Mycobacterium sp. CVI_P3]|uniref:Alpha/beta hydrolase n=1 Tax=Mycobacterium pinniadriaticum TaxID=2994102 RepID=A0ABT3SF60_9MYCO|nr:alpha/beta hydrolase [Mycobacterium pinniadriaticum]MCX2931774.1 alpha/beta hydrolase [Mycobacterium pinniadriaticum]MCX2938151.1 alpha/beta hydrolase [Mycobacterium pinniadriaticum]